MLTRSEVATHLDTSLKTVRNLETRGFLRPVKLEGVNYFTRHDVAQAIEARPRAICGKAFALFKEGIEPIDAVVELDADPDHIDRLYRTFKRMEGCWVVQGPKSLRAWEPVYRLGELTPRKLLKCVELVSGNPRLRKEIEGL